MDKQAYHLAGTPVWAKTGKAKNVHVKIKIKRCMIL
jgi:hypothetical protein